LENVTLLEEPQAALYAWIAHSGDAWRSHLHAGDRVLVIDIGGGTTDFSLIDAVEQDGSLELSRVAVGDHILLGGDNMDLALAHVVGEELAEQGKELDRFQVGALGHACRSAKEQLLSDATLEQVAVVLPSRGSATPPLLVRAWRHSGAALLPSDKRGRARPPEIGRAPCPARPTLRRPRGPRPNPCCRPRARCGHPPRPARARASHPVRRHRSTKSPWCRRRCRSPARDLPRASGYAKRRRCGLSRRTRRPAALRAR